MVDKLSDKPTQIDKAVLEKVEATISTHGKILDWCQYGQPYPDRFCGRVEVKPAAAGRLIDDLLRIDFPRINLDVFPLGIPAIDRVVVGFRSGSF